MKVFVKRGLLLLPFLLLLAFTSANAEVVKIEDYEYYQDGIFVEVKSAYRSTAGLTADGRLFTWGNNSNGQLGTGDYEDSGSPIDINPLMNLNPGEVVTLFDVGEYHMMAVTSENRIFGWGYNQFGEIGDNTTVKSNVPIDITSNFGLGVGEYFTEVEAGWAFSMVLTSDGRFFSFGRGWDGSLCNGTFLHDSTVTDNTATLTLLPGEVILNLEATGYHVLAYTNLDNLYAWGDNQYGQLFLGDNTDRNTNINILPEFTLLPSEDISAYSVGLFFSAVATTEGKVYTAGMNTDTQLGDGTSINKNTPTDISSNFGFEAGEYLTAVSSSSHTIALTNEGRVFGWGDNGNSNIGEWSVLGSLVITPLDITDAFTFDNETGDKVAVSYGNSYVLSDDNRMFSWGTNYNGQLGIGEIGSAWSTGTPVAWSRNFDVHTVNQEFLVKGFLKMSANYEHAVVIVDGETLYGWGENQFGELGLGDRSMRTLPTDLSSGFNLDPGETYIDVATGDGHTIILTSNYRVLAAGDNSQGQLGNGGVGSYHEVSIDITANIPLDTEDYIVSIYCGYKNTFLVSNNGELFAFGKSSNGALLTGSTATERSPVNVTDNIGMEATDQVDYVAASLNHTIIVTADKRVFAVGYNYYGQLGDGTEINRINPVEITSNIPFDLQTIDIVSLDVGNFISGMLNSEGDLYMWGSANFGALGEGGLLNRSTPFLITNQISLDPGEKIVSYTSGYSHSFITTNLGRVMSYGYGNYGALGNLNSTNEVHPLDVTANLDIGSDTVDYFVLGRSLTFIISQEGGIYGIGTNTYGQLGVGDTSYREIPVGVTKDSEDLAEVHFIYMQEEQYLDNSHVYIEIYFEYDIYEYLEYIVVEDDVTHVPVYYYQTDVDEDVGKVTVRIPNSYSEFQVVNFVVQGFSFGDGYILNDGPRDVSCSIWSDIQSPIFDTIGDQEISTGSEDVDWTTYIVNLEDNSPGPIILSEVDNVNYYVVGTYSVSVTAEDEAGNFYTETFNVDVLDDVLPVIVYNGVTTLEVGDPPYDFTANVVATDNLDGDITHLVYLDNTVDYNSVGEYTIHFSVYDSSMNLAELDVIILVEDTTPPTYDFQSTITLELGTSNVDWTSGILNLDDNSGGQITTSEVEDDINYFVEGEYTATVRATDESGNYQDKTVTVTIEDTAAPTCDPIGDITIEAGEHVILDYSQFVFNVVELSLIPIDISWTDVVNYDAVGIYNMSVSLTDNAMNVSTYYFDVQVVDTTPPEISYIGELEYEVGTLEPTWSDLVIISDNSEGTISIQNITEDLDIFTIGEYTVTYYVYDEAGNPAQLTVYISVLDTTSPEIIYTGEMEYELGIIEPLWSELITINDNSGENLSIDSIIEEVDIYEIGEYTITYYVYDGSGNQSELVVYISVVDTTPPEFIEPYPDLLVEQSEDSFIMNADPLDNITDASNQITIDFICDVVFGVVGDYTCTITAYDPSGNSSDSSFSVTIFDDIPPVLLLIGDDPMYVEFGETYIEPGIDCPDDDCGLIMNWPELPDDSTPGQYILEYLVYDDAGNESIITRTVIVQDTTPPDIYLNSGIDTIYAGVEHIDAGIQVVELGDYTIEITSNVDETLPGSYMIEYTVTDDVDNESIIVRHVTVQDPIPVIRWDIGNFKSTLQLGEDLEFPDASLIAEGNTEDIVINAECVEVNVTTQPLFECSATHEGVEYSVSLYYWDFDIEAEVATDGYYRKKEWEVLI